MSKSFRDSRANGLTGAIAGANTAPSGSGKITMGTVRIRRKPIVPAQVALILAIAAVGT
jgi:hypothetical protein